MSFKPSENLAEQIAQYLSEKIIRSEFKPGERIFEEKLSKELGVSRSPIREAFRILEKSGLVELIPRKGVRVTGLARPHIECLYDILTELYRILTTKSLEKANDDALQMLLVILQKMKDFANSKNVEGYYNALFELASIALKVADIPLLEKMIVDLWPTKRRIEYATLSLRKDELKKNLKFIQNAIHYAQDGNVEMSAKAMCDYVQTEKMFALKFVKFD